MASFARTINITVCVSDTFDLVNGHSLQTKQALLK